MPLFLGNCQTDLYCLSSMGLTSGMFPGLKLLMQAFQSFNPSEIKQSENICSWDNAGPCRNTTPINMTDHVGFESHCLCNGVVLQFHLRRK